MVYEKSAAIQGYTNSLATMDRQIAQMDIRITELKESARTNEQFASAQKQVINKLQIECEGLTNEVADYKKTVATLEAKLKETYEGISKQNEAFKELVAQRDEFVKKYNDSVKDRNDIVAKYNELAEQVKKLQSGGGKQ